MRLFLSVLVVCGVLSCSSQQGGQKGAIHLLNEKLHPRAVNVLSHPDNVTIYEMAPMFQRTEDRLGKYGVLKEGESLDNRSLQRLNNLLLDEKSYRLKPVKKSLFAPQVAFRFQKGEDEVLVFVSFSSMQLTFDSSSKVFVVDCEPIIEKLRLLVDRILNVGGCG